MGVEIHPKITVQKAQSPGIKTRRLRRQPLLALGDRRIGREHCREGTSQQLLQANNMSDKARGQLYEKLYRDLLHFLERAPRDWEKNEECRRFTVFGECITCAHWEGHFFISSADIIKVELVLYRLKNMGKLPPDRRRFEEAIYNDMRSLRIGVHAWLEQANSPLLQFLYRLSSVRTHKKQKVFLWDKVPFLQMHNGITGQSHKRQKILGQKHTKSVTMHSPTASPRSSGSDSGSPKSWGAFVDNSPIQTLSTASAFIQFMPNICGELTGPSDHSDIMKLAMVADAALALESSSGSS